MIIDHVSNIKTYETVSADIASGLKFIATIDENIAIGTHRIGKNIKVLVNELKTRVLKNVKYEAHKKSIDIHYLIRGKEIIKTAPVSSLSRISEYDPKNDVAFYLLSSKNIDLLLGDGMFFVFFPQDAHCPGIAIDGNVEIIKKAVVKISIEP